MTTLRRICCVDAGWGEGEGGSDQGGGQQWGPGDGGCCVERWHGALGPHHVGPAQRPGLPGLLPRSHPSPLDVPPMHCLQAEGTAQTAGGARKALLVLQTANQHWIALHISCDMPEQVQPFCVVHLKCQIMCLLRV